MGATRRNRGLVDWRIRVGGGCSIRLIERPGLAMDAEADKRALLEYLKLL